MAPVLGQHPLAKVTPSAVRAWYMTLKGKYVTTGDDAYRMLRAVLTAAVTDDVIARNPRQVNGAGNTHSAERPVASVAELTRAVDASPEQYRVAVLLAAWCQLRRGEVLGLQRRDVNLRHGTIRVERSVVRPMKGPVIVGPPKTAAGIRTLGTQSRPFRPQRPPGPFRRRRPSGVAVQ